MAPKRIQRKRTKGWRKPEGAVCVSRPGHWGNPWNTAWAFRHWLVCDKEFYRKFHPERRKWMIEHLKDLRGKDLVCWCNPEKECHADVLLELANS
jgi:hypothetical protein